MEAAEPAPAVAVAPEATISPPEEPAAPPPAEPPAADKTDEAPAVADEAPAAARTKSPAAKKAAAKTPAAKPQATPASDAGTGTGGRARRERKPVDFFVPVAPATKELEEVVAVGAGSGTRLRDIPNVAFKLGKLTGRDELVEGLHNVLFRRKGVANQRKKAVLDFSGFAFAEDAKAKELEARRASLGKWKLELVHRLMDALDLARGSGDKAAKVERVLEFLQQPKALTEVDLAAKEASKKEKEKAKRERAAAKKSKGQAKEGKGERRKSGGGDARPAKKAKKDVEEGESEPEEEEEEEEEASGAEAEESEEEEKLPAKKDRKAGVSRQRAAPADAGAEPMEEDEPEAAQDPATQVPSAELKAAVEEVLAALPPTELPSITTKPILKKLEANYGFSLKPRKEEVIAIAQAYVQAYVEAHPEPAEEEAAVEPAEAEAAASAEAAPAEPAAEPEAEPAAEAEGPAAAVESVPEAADE